MTTKCTMCGEDGLVKISSQNTKLCTGCGHEEAWPLEDGQQPLVGSHRQKSGTPVKVDGAEPASLEELIGKPGEHAGHDGIFRAISVLGQSAHKDIMTRVNCLNDIQLNLFGRTLDQLLQRIAPEGSCFQAMQAELRALGTAIADTHTCYEKGDEGCPEQILDRNGDVVLGLCKHCGAGESELSQQVCTGEVAVDRGGELVSLRKCLADFTAAHPEEGDASKLFASFLRSYGVPSFQDDIDAISYATPRIDPDHIRRSYRFADVCEEDYLQLALVLQRAHDQAAYGKGKERHAKGQPFHEQRMQTISQLLDSPDGMAYQVVKKVTEGLGLPERERQVAELLGAINYLAGIVIFLESKDRASAAAGAV